LLVQLSFTLLAGWVTRTREVEINFWNRRVYVRTVLSVLPKESTRQQLSAQSIAVAAPSSNDNPIAMVDKARIISWFPLSSRSGSRTPGIGPCWLEGHNRKTHNDRAGHECIVWGGRPPVEDSGAPSEVRWARPARWPIHPRFPGWDVTSLDHRSIRHRLAGNCIDGSRLSGTDRAQVSNSVYTQHGQTPDLSRQRIPRYRCSAR
jgi:hypothetical protein